MQLYAILGQDISAYAGVEIDVPDGASKEEIIDRIRAFTESADFDEVVFDEDWGTACALRIVSVQNGGNYILEDVLLDQSPYDAGQVLQSWLNGSGPTLAAVINTAAEAKLINPVVIEVHRGSLKLPGAETIEVEFECRKGATREEKDLAFLEALAQIGTVDYVAIGEVHHGV